MVVSIVDNLLNTVVQRAGLRNVGCPVLCEVKCNYYICNKVAPVCPTECVGDISGEAASSVEINKGIGGRRAAVARLAAMVVADIKKEQPRQNRRENEGEQQTESERERERKRADGKSTEEHSETTWQQGIARRTVQVSQGVCSCRWTVQESLTCKEDTDEPDAVSSTRRWTERRDPVRFKKILTSRMRQHPPMD